MHFKPGPVDHGSDTQFRVIRKEISRCRVICFLTVAHTGIHTASGAKLQHDGGRLGTNFQNDEQSECFSTRVQFRNKGCLLAVSLSRGTGVILAQILEHCSFLIRPRRNRAKHRCTRKRVCSLSKGFWLRLLLTAGVSDEVAQELQMPMGPQMLEDVEEPMPARPATLRSRHSRSDRDGTTQSDTLSESTLVQDVCRIQRK